MVRITASAVETLRSQLSMGLRLLPYRPLAKRYSPVLTYHATYGQRPKIVSAADNVSPSWLFEHLSELKKYYRFVPIDEFAEARTTRGLAAVTFDDGYKCVIDEALPVFEALDIPFTMFLTASSLDQKVFWRHKVVYIVNHGLVAECERHFQRTRKIPNQQFFTYLKNPLNHSGTAEAEIDEFLNSRNIRLDGYRYLIDRESYLLEHPLIWYGNHSYSHYVLSSLSREEQHRQIQSGLTFLNRRPHLKISNVFAPPFGQAEHINEDTFDVLRELGYRSLVLNCGGLSGGEVVHQGIRIIDRFSPAETTMTWQCKKYWARRVVAGQLVKYTGGLAHSH
jgi:peptidoglycan/xylan/chitin deacetylase (PgdA/CDA1 family)